MDMLNSDWPIGEVGVRTLAAPEAVEHVGVTLDRIWWDRPFTVTNVGVFGIDAGTPVVPARRDPAPS